MATVDDIMKEWGKNFDDDIFTGSFMPQKQELKNIIKEYNPSWVMNVDEYSSEVERVSNNRSVPKEVINALIMTESTGDKNAKSSAGAIGLTQILPEAHGMLESDLYNVEENIDYGTKYLQQLKDKYGDWDIAIAAYNWGPGNMDAHIKKHGEVKLDELPAETRRQITAYNFYYGLQIY